MGKSKKAKTILMNSLHEQRWDATEAKTDYDFDNNFGELMTATMREKIFILIINIFKALFNEDKEYVLKKMPRLLNMVKIHTYQLFRLKTYFLNSNIHYFREAIRTIYVELRSN